MTNNPELIVNEIQDIYLRRNFLQLVKYFKEQNQLLDFKFFEVKFTDKTLTQTVNHGLKFIPRDIVFLGATNNATVSFNIGKFSLQSLDITANKETTLRFYVGKYFNDLTTNQPAKEDVIVFGPDSFDSATSATTYKGPTLVKITSGTGPYVPATGCKYFQVKMVGAGGGGGGSGTAGPTQGTSGTATTFGAALLTANGGAGALSLGGTGGTATVDSSIINYRATQGGTGAGNTYMATGGVFTSTGGMGAGTPFCGGGASSTSGPNAAVANTGVGGGGGGMTGAANFQSGAGGGAGGYIEAIISKLEKSYAYSIGTGGTGGIAGVGGQAGANGSNGYIEITEFYQ